MTRIDPHETSALLKLPASWKMVVGEELHKPYFDKLIAFIVKEAGDGKVLPPLGEVYAALEHTPYEKVRVVLLGQDPYPGEGQAHGLCFSVRPGVKLPASLRNIFKELQADIGCTPPRGNGSLMPWADQGVLMLNTVLTVRAGLPLSHRGKGWETFTDEVIRAVNRRKKPVVFALWGGMAQKKAALVDSDRHAIVTAAHPSPLSAHHGYFDSKPFSRINEALRRFGEREIAWCLNDSK